MARNLNSAALKPVSEMTPEELSAFKQGLKGQALRALRDNHTDEYHRLVGEIFAKNDLTYERPLTQAEIEMRTLAELAGKHGYSLVKEGVDANSVHAPKDAGDEEAEDASQNP